MYRSQCFVCFFLSICAVLPHTNSCRVNVYTFMYMYICIDRKANYRVFMWGLGVDRESGSDDSQCSIDWVTLCKVLDTHTCTVWQNIRCVYRV